MKTQQWKFLGLFALVVMIAACGVTPMPGPVPTTVPGGETIHGEAVVEEIEILILESFPVQIHIIARGDLPNGCTEIDQIVEERTADGFLVTITTVRPIDAMCTEALVPFEEVIALDVLGLPAGTYQVEVNGVTDDFELTMDNVPQTEPES